MLSQGRRLQRLIADLLLLASLERPAHRNHLQQCNLAEICVDVLEDFSEAAAGQGFWHPPCECETFDPASAAGPAHACATT